MKRKTLRSIGDKVEFGTAHGLLWGKVIAFIPECRGIDVMATKGHVYRVRWAY